MKSPCPVQLKIQQFFQPNHAHCETHLDQDTSIGGCSDPLTQTSAAKSAHRAHHRVRHQVRHRTPPNLQRYEILRNINGIARRYTDQCKRCLFVGLNCPTRENTNNFNSLCLIKTKPPPIGTRINWWGFCFLFNGRGDWIRTNDP